MKKCIASAIAMSQQRIIIITIIIPRFTLVTRKVWRQILRCLCHKMRLRVPTCTAYSVPLSSLHISFMYMTLLSRRNLKLFDVGIITMMLFVNRRRGCWLLPGNLKINISGRRHQHVFLNVLYLRWEGQESRPFYKISPPHVELYILLINIQNITSVCSINPCPPGTRVGSDHRLTWATGECLDNFVLLLAKNKVCTLGKHLLDSSLNKLLLHHFMLNDVFLCTKTYIATPRIICSAK